MFAEEVVIKQNWLIFLCDISNEMQTEFYLPYSLNEDQLIARCVTCVIAS